MSGSSGSRPLSDGDRMSTIRAGDVAAGPVGRGAAAAAPRQAWLEEPWPHGGKRWRPGIAKSPTSAKTSTTNRPARSSSGTTCWWWRTCRSPTCCGGPNPCPTPTTPGSFCPTEPGRSPGSTGVSVTLAGASSSRFCAPKRKTLGAPGLRSTPGTPPTAARTAVTQHRRTASPKRTSPASDASHRAQADEHAARNILRAGLALHAQAA